MLDVISDVDTFCGAAQNMMYACDQDCHDEAHALTACMLEWGGCPADHCSSPGFMAGVSIASALGAVVAVMWIFLLLSKLLAKEDGCGTEEVVDAL